MKGLLIGLVIFSSLAWGKAALGQEQVRAPEIKGRVWFNARSYKRVTLKGLRGHVVVVFFWTSHELSCDYAALNLNRWYAFYKQKGLEVIGVYAPGWEFKVSQSGVFKKIDELNIKFPVVIDEEGLIRQAYGLPTWPSFTLVGRDGYVRTHYSGLFTYPEIEKSLKGLLEESKPR